LAVAGGDRSFDRYRYLHPASRYYLVPAADKIGWGCSIQRGRHPADHQPVRITPQLPQLAAPLPMSHGREWILPNVLAVTHKKYQIPYVASAIQTAISLTLPSSEPRVPIQPLRFFYHHFILVVH
jgi:hypothetical protein